MKNKHLNCIIDTDPGVDDSAALSLSLYDDVMDIKLVTTMTGNCDIDTVTRNALHILEKFGRSDIPLAKGFPTAMKRVSADARFIHQNEGMGNYIPPKTTKKQPIELDAVEAMYETIKKYPNDISIIELGPHTNIGHLLERHPDAASMINRIYCEGCAPYGYKGETHISFNVSSDPEAFKLVLESGIPITIIPSKMGRQMTHFTESDVFKIRDTNDTGRFLFEAYNGYWEPNCPDRRIATNDTCAVLIARFPEIFKTKKVFMTVDIDETPGKTFVEFNRHGNIDYAYGVNRKKFQKCFFRALDKYNRFRFYPM